MPVELGIVTPILEAKLKGKGFTKTYGENLAKTIAAKVDKDEDVEPYIDGVMDILLETPKEGNRRAEQAAKTKEQELKAKLNGETGNQDDPAPLDPAKVDDTVLQLLRKMDERMNRIETGNEAKSIEQRIKADPRTKDLPDAWLEDRVMPTAENFDAWADKTQATFKTFATDTKLQGFGGDAPGGTGQTGGKATKEASKAELDALEKAMNI